MGSRQCRQAENNVRGDKNLKFTLDVILFLGTHKATVANQRTTKVEEYGGGQYNKWKKEKMEGNQRTRSPD